MEHIFTFVEHYGLPAFVIAACTILILGILKLCKVFDKIQSKNVKKTIYLVIDIVLAFVGTAIYYAIFGISFNTAYLYASLMQIGATLSAYAIFEGTHLREGLLMILTWIKSWFKTHPDALDKALKKLGLTEEQVASLKTEASNLAETNKATQETTEATPPTTPQN